MRHRGLRLRGQRLRASPYGKGLPRPQELEEPFRGYGYTPYFVEGDQPETMHQLMASTLDTIVNQIRSIQTRARAGGHTERPLWPMIVLRTPKGWTGQKEVDGKKTEASWRSHQVPMGEMHENPGHVKVLEEWMKSYRPQELFDSSGRLKPELAELAPKGRRRIGGQSARQRGSAAEGSQAPRLPGLRGPGPASRRDGRGGDAGDGEVPLQEAPSPEEARVPRYPSTSATGATIVTLLPW